MSDDLERQRAVKIAYGYPIERRKVAIDAPHHAASLESMGFIVLQGLRSWPTYSDPMLRRLDVTRFAVQDGCAAVDPDIVSARDC